MAPKSLKQFLVKHRQLAREGAYEGWKLDEIFESMLISSLSPTEQKALSYIDSMGPQTTREMANRLKCSVPSASNHLRHLWKLGLIAREAVKDERGLCYSWKVY